MALGILNLTIYPAVSCVTLVYLVVIFLLQRRQKRSDDFGSQSSSHPLPLPSTLPSVVVAYLLSLWWFAVTVTIFIGLVSTNWGGFSLHFTLVVAYFFTALAESEVCFFLAVMMHMERRLSLQNND